MSKPWGGAGAWAAEAEREEAEQKAAAAAAAESQSFPSLREAANAKTGKKKRQTMSLGEFNAGGSTSGGGGGGRDSTGLTPDEMMRLPTGPKERSADEMQFSGRGFSSYGRQGMGGGGGGRGREREDGGGRRSYGGFDEERRGGGNSRVSDFDQMPSRADEADSWKTEKKPPPLAFDSGRQSRYGGGGGGGGGPGFGGPSRADEADNWAFGKKPLPARSSSYGSGGGGGGFRGDSEQPDRWARGTGFREGERERPRLVLDPPKGNSSGAGDPALAAEVKANKPSPFGAARPREEVLAEKGLDWKKLDSEIEAKKATATTTGSRPTSAHSSRPSSAQSARSESGPGLQGTENAAASVKPRPKMNPFGDAKPREVLLEEKGKDWRKIDLELERRRGIVERHETEDEKMLKEELENLKKELKENPQDPSGDEPSLHDRIRQREAELEQLTRDLDNKLRFGQKAAERPGSGAGRGGGGSGFYHERPHSQSGSHEEPRSAEFMERPRSRGTSDIWMRPVDDRRGFQGGRERGFLGSRDSDRARSRERW